MGRVFNLKYERILKPREALDGAQRVSLSKDGEVTDIYIHHLVFEAFYGTRGLGTQVFHADGDKTNNRPENLRLRRKERIIPRRSMPEHAAEYEEGDRHWGRPIIIVETREVFPTVRDCANYIGGDYSTIYKCLEGLGRRTHRGYTFAYYTGGQRAA